MRINEIGEVCQGWHNTVDCPRAASDFTHCAARDGQLATAKGRCLGCDELVAELFKDLVGKYVRLVKSID
jgi:hypothetical protein